MDCKRALYDRVGGNIISYACTATECGVPGRGGAWLRLELGRRTAKPTSRNDVTAVAATASPLVWYYDIIILYYRRRAPVTPVVSLSLSHTLSLCPSLRLPLCLLYTRISETHLMISHVGISLIAISSRAFEFVCNVAVHTYHRNI